MVGVWNVVRPWGDMETAQLNAHSAFTKEPIAGVSYTPMPFLDTDKKNKAVALSAALASARPTSAELGPYKKGDGDWCKKFLGVMSVAFLLPQAAQGLWLWGFQSYMHAGLLIWLGYSTYLLGNKAAMNISVGKKAVHSVELGFAFLRDSTFEAYVKMEGVKAHFGDMASRMNATFDLTGDKALIGYDVLIGLLMTIIRICLVYVFRGQIKKLFNDLYITVSTGTPPQSPTLSAFDTATAPPPVDWAPLTAEQPPSPRTGAYNMFMKTLEKQNESLERLSRRIDGIDSPRSPSGSGGDDVGELRRRVAEHERILAADQGKDLRRSVTETSTRATRATSPDGSLLKMTAGPIPTVRGTIIDDKGDDVFCKILTSMPRGSPALGEMSQGVVEECPKSYWTAGTRFHEEGLTIGDQVLENTIRPLLNLSINAHALLLEEIKRFTNVPQKEWPLPKGYKVWIAAAYLAHVFSKYGRGEEYGRKFIENHGLLRCAIAEQIVSLLRQFDRFLLVDKITGWINWPTVEYMCRKCYGIELAFGRCKTPSDWLKPTNAGKGWVSKVDWRAPDKVDPDGDGSRPNSDVRLEALDEELKAGMEHDALLAKARAKLNDLSEQPADRTNDLPRS